MAMPETEDSSSNIFIGIDIDVQPPSDNSDKRGPHHESRGSTRSSKQASSKTRFPKTATTTTTSSRTETSSTTDPAASASASASGTQRPRKPKPPPDPPRSLVSLIQKDGLVRSYFQSLQENLDYDVQKWKHEAGVWKRLASASTAVLSPPPPPAAATTSTAAAAATTTTTPCSLAKRKNNAKKKRKTNLNYERGAEKNARLRPSSIQHAEPTTINSVGEEEEDENDVPITDEILFADLSDSSSSSSSSSSDSSSSVISCDRKSKDLRPKESKTSSKRNNCSPLWEINPAIDTNNERRIIDSRHVLNNLKLAKKWLDLLGVSLVEVEVKTIIEPTLSPLTETVDTTLHPSTRSYDGGSSSCGCSDRGKKENFLHNNRCNNSSHDCDNLLSITKTEKIMRRQSDEKVVSDMMASLRTLIKTSSFISQARKDDADDNDDLPDDETGEFDRNLSHEERLRNTQLSRYFHPFCRGGVLHCIPNVYHSEHHLNTSNRSVTDLEGGDSWLQPDHPASIGLNHLIHVLMIMDVYCGDDIDDNDWKAIFTKDTPTIERDQVSLSEEMLTLQIGMRNRCRLTERVLSSLDTEITKVWSLTDRATNHITSSVHFHPADALDRNHSKNDNIVVLEDFSFFGVKSYNRLVMLEEKVAHARIASLLHHRRGNLQKAAELVVGYIISSAPSIGTEHYPKLPPVLSLCVLEALLAPENYFPENYSYCGIDSTAHKSDWFQKCIYELLSNSGTSLLKAIAYPVRTAVNLWRERKYCIDDRIRDIATVELAAFDRIQRLVDGSDWLSDPNIETMTVDRLPQFGILAPSMTCLDQIIGMSSSESLDQEVVSVISWTVLLLTWGKADEVIRVSETIMGCVMNAFDDQISIKSFLYLLPGCCFAHFHIMCRRWESMKLGNTVGRQTAAAFTIEDKFSPILDALIQSTKVDDWRTIDIMIQCCAILGDGHRLLQLCNRVVPAMTHSFMAQNADVVSSEERKLLSRTLTTLIDVGEIPTVRIINLERRPDRKYDFMACAVNNEQLIVIQGPSIMRRKHHAVARSNPKGSYSQDEYSIGTYAFDGKCNLLDLEEQLKQRMDENISLTDFVSTKWRPSDLKAFDENARDDFELVDISMSERACALSHIASWMGVESTLTGLNSAAENEYCNEFYHRKLLGMLRISGFARGPVMLHENEGMDPVPVCIILEDDAVLNDRFSERLALLLEELPRDFHFCSLGYSRPKTAPMIEYSTHLSIPSCIWYLTGYILSLDGARHLIQSLPVTGPVDNWIGLKMCSNWDNKFGDIVGVGKAYTSHGKIARKDLAKIMKFRAFAAVVPLCAQKVGTVASSAVSRGGWRDRDTDITYSG